MGKAMQPQRSVLLAACVLLGTACAGNVSDPGPGKRAQLSLATTAYVSGETVTFVLNNVSTVSLEYASPYCQRELQQQQQDGTWSTVVARPNGCTLELAYLGAGQSVPLPYRLPRALPSGSYRVAIPEPAPENAGLPKPTVTTPSFSVTGVSSNQP